MHLDLLLQSRKETMLTKIDGAAMDSETVQMLSIIDEEKDANVIINSEGIIQFANKGVTTVCAPAQTCKPQHYHLCLDTWYGERSHGE